MKQLTVTAGPARNQSSTQVRLSGFKRTDKLTPAMARSAARTGFGHTNGVTVQDSENEIAYRLSGGRTRKIRF